MVPREVKEETRDLNVFVYSTSLVLIFVCLCLFVCLCVCLFAHILHFNTNDHETVDDDADGNPRCQEVEPSLHVPEGQRVDCTGFRIKDRGHRAVYLMRTDTDRFR